MKRSETAQTWNEWFHRIKARFPHVDDEEMACLDGDPARLEVYLAETHNLTLKEAREGVRDFLDIEKLAREAFDMRAGDVAPANSTRAPH